MENKGCLIGLGVLILLVAPRSRTTAILGDQGIDRACGSDLWPDVLDLLQKELPTDPNAALVAAINRVGQKLAEHFPPRPDDINELPDKPRYD